MPLPTDNTRAHLQEQLEHAVLLLHRHLLREDSPQLGLRRPPSLLVQLPSAPPFFYQAFSKLRNAPVVVVI